MNEAQSHAYATWRDAEKAYHEQMLRHVAFDWSENWSLPSESAEGTVEEVTPAALERIAELRQAAADAQQRFRDALPE